MAITSNDVKLLFYAHKCGISFEKTLTLGRLKLYVPVDSIQQLANRSGFNHRSIKDIPFPDAYSEPLFEFLGSKLSDSIDVSDYEKATLIHDMNQPVPSLWENKYSVVIDSGTLEHIFNFPQAIMNCMKMIRAGGHFIGITPVNNLMGHGFYQFSPELYFRVFNEENGFRIKKLMIASAHEDGSYSDWYEVADPKMVKSRVILVNQLPTYLMIFAEKISSETIFKTFPQQSDYTEKWNKAGDQKQQKVSWKKKIYQALIPAKLRDVIYILNKSSRTKNLNTLDLGALNKDHFKKVDDID
ncbi:MAG: hypothetical protein ABI772_02990 [Bacteroidota bacterium]